MIQEQKSGGNKLAIAIMFMLFFMIAFVTNFAGSMGVIVKNQFHASNALSQLGSAANFFAYFFMGIPGGLILKRKGYKVTALLAVAVGILGVGIQLLSGYAQSFAVYVSGAFVAGFSMCLLNLVVNPMLNTLGGGGNKGNQLVQFGCTLNSIGAMLAPVLLGYLIGGQVAKAQVNDAAPALIVAMLIFVLAFVVLALSKIPEPHLETAEEKAHRPSVVADIAATLKFRHFTLGAMAIFCYVIIESGIPNMANLYMTTEKFGDVANPAFVGGVVAGSVVAVYWFSMMIGRLIGAVVGAHVSSRAQIAFCAVMGIACLLASMYLPVKMVKIGQLEFPLAMCTMALCGLFTSVMWGGIFNMAAEGLGRYVPMGSGIFMSMVVGGLFLPIQGYVADTIGILNSYWFTIALFAYVLYYALFGSRIAKKNQ